MEQQISNIATTLNMVVKNMVKVSDLDEKIKQLVTMEQLNSTVNNLRESIEQTNGEIIGRLESRVLQLEMENDDLKRRFKTVELNCETQTEMVNDLEQQSRKNNIRIFGMEDKN